MRIKLKVDPYGLISDAVASGIMGGLNKARKYSEQAIDERLADDICLKVHEYVMLNLTEIIDFESIDE